MIDLKTRKPVVGDIVRFVGVRDLRPYVCMGKVIAASNFAVRVHTFKPGTIDLSEERMEVRIGEAVVQIDPYDMLRYCKEKFQMIAAQDQGLGGQATLQQCWNNARNIANEAVTALGAVSEEVGGARP